MKKLLASEGTVGEKDQLTISWFEVSRVRVPEAPPHNFWLHNYKPYHIWM